METLTRPYLSTINDFNYLRTLDSDADLPSLEQFSPDFKNYFQIGQTSYYVLAVPKNIPETAEISLREYEKVENSTFGIACIHQQIHPDDLDFYYNCEQKTNEFFERLSSPEFSLYKTRFDFRCSINGLFKRFLQQRVVLEYENETIKSFLVIMTDISDLKCSLSSHFSIIEMNEKECCDPNYASYIKVEDPFPLSKREKEVYVCLMESLSSKEIAIKLFVSVETIKNHRKRILKKTSCKNTLELIMTSHENGWI